MQNRTNNRLALTGLAIAAIAFAAGAANAAIVPGAFVPDAFEDFESFDNVADSFVASLNVFGGAATVSSGAASGLDVVLAGQFNLDAGGFAQPVSPTQLLGDNSGAGPTTFSFNSDIFGFGGYFHAGYSPADSSTAVIVFEAFDAGNTSLGTLTFLNGNTNGVLDFFSFTSNTPIRTVTAIGISATYGSFPVFDDLQTTSVPAPGAAALLGLGGIAALRRRRSA